MLVSLFSSCSSFPSFVRSFVLSFLVDEKWERGQGQRSEGEDEDNADALTTTATTATRPLRAKLRNPTGTGSKPRTLATVASDIPVRRYGGLKDQDRIFTNAYCRHDHGIKGALVRSLPPPPPPSLWSSLPRSLVRRLTKEWGQRRRKTRKS